MKKIFVLFIAIFAMCVSVEAKELTSKQLRLRSEINSFLKSEGFMPSIDSDGDIKFKKEGIVYYVMIDANETSPMYVSLVTIYEYDDYGKWSRNWFKNVMPEINLYKGVSLVLYDSSAYLSTRMFVTDAEHFNRTFYRMMEVLEAAIDELRETE